MNRKRLEGQLTNIQPILYAFSYALIPEELQAQQIVIDVIQKILIEKKENIVNTKSIYALSFESLKIILEREGLKIVYQLALKRFHQLKNGLKVKDKAFYQLELNERAVLFLKYRMRYSSEEIEEVLGTDRYTITAILNRSRDKLLLELKHGEIPCPPLA